MTHGSSYFLSTEQLINKNLGKDISQPLSINRIFLGKLAISYEENKETIINRALVYAPEQGHLITVAPTRSGKGVSHVIPNLLNYTGSVVVNDIKGENAAVTARFREESLGHKVYRFAPFEKDSAKWNPLDFINEDGNTGADAALIAEMLIMDEKGEHAFWNNEAKNLLRGVIMYVKAEGKPKEHTMETVRELLTQPPDDLQKTLETLSASKEKLVKRSVNAFLQADGKVRSGIISTINSNMSVWDYDEVERVTGSSDFKFEDLKNGRVSIYFCIPPEHLDVYAPVMRLFFGQAMAAMSRNIGKPELPVLFILDEFPQLGRMKPIQKGMSYLAGYGVRLWLFAQNLGQIRSSYGIEDAQGIISNCTCSSFFGTNDNDTAKQVSDMCGMMTVPVMGISKNTPEGLFTTSLGSNSDNISLTSQPIMKPQEVTSMPAGKDQLIFAQGENPIMAELMPYYLYPKMFSPTTYDEWEGH